MTTGPVLVDAHPDNYLDVFGQQPILGIYTLLTLCYDLPDSASKEDITQTLTAGIERLSSKFRWTAGQVVNEGATKGDSGSFRITPYEDNVRLFIKDLRDDQEMPTMDALRKADFPMNMLDETIISPRNTIPGTFGEPISKTAPVFMVQANFIKGGLLLSFCGQHQTMDVTGQGQVMSLLSRACRNEPFTREELFVGNLPRRDLIPLLGDSYKQGVELAGQICKPRAFISEGLTPPPSPRPPCVWANFAFSAEALAALKEEANNPKTLPPSGFVSTDDALTALLWQATARIRVKRTDPDTTSNFARAIDVRRYLNIPDTYTGLCQNMTYHNYTMQELCDMPLGAIAADFRKKVDPASSDVAYRTKALATAMSRAPDKTTFSFTAALEMKNDFMLSSWAKIDSYDLDFGLGLSTPEAVRRPLFHAIEGLAYLLPKSHKGEMVAAVCLRKDDMESIREDKHFTQYATYVG